MLTLRRFVGGAIAVATWAAVAGAQFVEFETVATRPMALSASGTELYVVNTPDNTLEILNVGAGGVSRKSSVPVGMEPVAVAVRPGTSEVWVVNHLSDSVSIVDVGTAPPRVTRTLLVGNEPRDIVFAGSPANRAFITAAHRGQNRPGNPQLTTAGVGRADVWVFNATNLGTSLGGTPLTILSLFGDTPRALAVSPNGATVYAAVFISGNKTTTVSEGVVRNGGASTGPCNILFTNYPGGLPAPNAERQHRRADRPRDGAHREAQRHQLGRPARAQLEQRRPLQSARPRRVRDQRDGCDPLAERVVRRRRHDRLQHGREPGEREALRLQHRGPERGPLTARPP
jgi:YVTN family beta-propeller protein